MWEGRPRFPILRSSHIPKQEDLNDRITTCKWYIRWSLCITFFECFHKYMNFQPETARYPALSLDGKISIKGTSSKNLLSSDQNGLVTKNSICDLGTQCNLQAYGVYYSSTVCIQLALQASAFQVQLAVILLCYSKERRAATSLHENLSSQCWGGYNFISGR